MLYVRGNRRDYDSWAQLGNYGWSYDDVLPYFIKSEDNRNPYLAESPYHGVGGYLTIQESPYKTPLATAFVEGGVELGNDRFSSFSFLLQYLEKTHSSRWQESPFHFPPVRNGINLFFFFWFNRLRTPGRQRSLPDGIHDFPRNHSTRIEMFDVKGIFTSGAEAQEPAYRNALARDANHDRS